MSQRPTPTAPRPYLFPDIVRSSLDNGLDLAVVPMPGRTLCGTTLVVRAGATEDKIEGVSMIAARMFNEGTKRLNAAEFAEASEGIGMQLGAGASWDAMNLSMDAPISKLEAALGLLAEAAWEPAFDEAAFERVKLERLASITQEMANPAIRAAVAMPPIIYSQGSAYAGSLRGTKESVQQIGLEDVREHHQRAFTHGSATLVVAGGVDPEEVHAMVASAFAGTQSSDPIRQEAQSRDAITQTRIHLVDRPGSVQSNLLVGHMGVERTHPELDAIQVAAYVLAGNFNSRINNRLREELGLTYGAQGAFDARRAPGPFSISTPVQGEGTAQAVSEILRLVQEFQSDGPTAEELEAAKDFLAGVHPLRFETTGSVADAIASQSIYGLPDEDLATLPERVRSLTLDEVAEAASKHLRPQASAVVVVGDAKAVRDDLEKIAPLELVED